MPVSVSLKSSLPWLAWAILTLHHGSLRTQFAHMVASFTLPVSSPDWYSSTGVHSSVKYSTVLVALRVEKDLFESR